MAEVGKSTGKKTQAGREVYETPDGEMVSEKSTTFKYKGKWINIPTIHNGYAYDDDMLRMMLDAEVIEPTSTHKSKEDAINSAIERSKSLKFNEGGLSSQTEEALGWAAEGKKLAVDTPEVSLRDAATFVAEMTPIVGDALAAKEVYDELQKDEPNYYLAGALGGAAIVGLVPGLGDVAAKAIKKGAREVFDAAKRVEVDPNAMGSGLGNVRLKPKDTPTNLTDQALTNTIDDLGLSADDLEKWREKNYAKNKFRVPPQEKLADAADALRQGEITSAEFRELSGVFQPIVPIKVMPKFPTKKDVAQALHATGGDKKVNKGIIGVNKTIEDGTQISARLDIPAYNDTDTWVVTLHDGADKSGATVGYGQTAVLNNVNFTTNPLAASSIAAGNSKATIARMNGEWQNMDPEAVYEKATKLLDSDEWVQVGMNPYRASYFYDKADGMPIMSAEQVIQVGPLVLAKKVKKTTPDDKLFEFTDKRTGVTANFNQGGKVMNNQMEMAFMKQGGIKDDGMKRDPVSGNEIPPGSMAKEVRDDIPAMLSEGEYVVPADVLRFYGVNFFEDLRNQAKSGLQGMEQNGRIGGEPLSPQQVQQNMGQAPVQANQGGMMQGFNQAGLAGTPTPSSTFDPSKYSVVGGSTFNNQGQQAQQDSVTTFKTFINSADGSTQIVEFVDGKLKNPAMEKFTQPPYYEQGSSALKKAQSQASSKDDKPDFPDPVKGEETKDWGLGVDWSDPKAYADSVLKNQMGRGKTSVLQGLSALAGPVGVAAVGAGLGIQALSQVSNLRAAAEIARAQGMDEQAESIDGMVKSFMAEQPAIVDFFDDIRGDSNKNALTVMDRMGLQYTRDPKTDKITYTPQQKKFNEIASKRAQMNNKAKADSILKDMQKSSGDDDGNLFPVTAVSIDTDPSGSTTQSMTYGSGDDAVTATADEDGLNKGGLMAPKKKKK